MTKFDVFFGIDSRKMARINELDCALVGVNEFESNLHQLAVACRVGLQVRDLKPS